jgi:hypothetical protein
MDPQEEKYEKVSKDLEYILNTDADGYTVTGIGTCKDTNLIIPSLYNGKPVTSIGMGAFESSNSLTSVVIPNSVTSIAEDAFAHCSNLAKITFKDSVEQWNKIEIHTEWIGRGEVPATEVVCMDGTVPLKKQSRYTVTKDVWNSNMDMINFTLTWYIGEGVITIKQTDNSAVYILNDQAYGYYYIENGVSYAVVQENEKWIVIPTAWVPQKWNSCVYIEKMQYDDFTFDEDRQAYVSTQFSTQVEGWEAVMKFENGKLISLETINLNDSTGYDKIAFANLGSTVVNVPDFTLLNN